MTAITEVTPVARALSARSFALAWAEGRPVVQGIYALRFITAVLLAAGPAAFATARVPIAAAGWVAGVWAVYLLNGVTDVVEDRANASARPIARGDLPVMSARVLTGLLALASLGLAAVVSARQAGLTLALLAVGAAYSAGPRPLKNSAAGCFAGVVLLGALTYSAGFSASSFDVGAGSLAVAAAMSLWMGFGGSTKDLSDVPGDRLAGRRTLPVVLGERAARRVLAVGVLALGGGYLVTVLTLRLTSAAALTCGAVLPAGALVVAGALLRPAAGAGDPGVTGRRARRRPYRAFMQTQYAVHVAVIVGAFV